MEYSYDDWTIYRLGKALNKPKAEIEIYAQRALNYKNLYDPKRKLMAGRAKDGSFSDSFNPTDWGRDFTEGNSWHYSWSVFHDPQGLIQLMGGEKEFVNMLDSVFIIPGAKGMESRSMIHVSGSPSALSWRRRRSSPRSRAPANSPPSASCRQGRAVTRHLLA